MDYIDFYSYFYSANSGVRFHRIRDKHIYIYIRANLGEFQSRVSSKRRIVWKCSKQTARNCNTTAVVRTVWTSGCLAHAARIATSFARASAAVSVRAALPERE